MLLLLLRFAKLLSVCALFAGTLGCVVVHGLDDRRRLAYRVAGPGFGATWLFGLLMIHQLGWPLFTTWIVASLALSIFSLQVVLFSVGREGRRTWLTAVLALTPLVIVVALMIWKPGGITSDD